MASDPATPTVPAPAPEVDVAAKRLVPSPEELIEASSASRSEVADPPLSAWTKTFARLIATAAPIPSAPAPTTLPSAVADASVSPVAFRARMPPALIATPVPIVAFEKVFGRFTAIAAATLTGPSEVLAGGVGVLPEPPPAGATESARPRWLAVCVVTSAPPEDAPLALAFAVVTVDDD